MRKKKRKKIELIMRCATCGDMLARITRLQPIPTLPSPEPVTDLIKGRYRLVTCRRRLIAMVTVYDQHSLAAEHSASHDDFRFRSVERTHGEENLRVWEFPYVCDGGDCYQKLLDDDRWRGYVGASPADFVRLPEVH